MIKLDADKILPFLTKCVSTFHRSLLVILKLFIKKSCFPTSKIWRVLGMSFILLGSSLSDFQVLMVESLREKCSNKEILWPEYRQIQTTKTPHLDTFHAVNVINSGMYYCSIIVKIIQRWTYIIKKLRRFPTWEGFHISSNPSQRWLKISHIYTFWDTTHKMIWWNLVTFRYKELIDSLTEWLTLYHA